VRVGHKQWKVLEALSKKPNGVAWVGICRGVTEDRKFNGHAKQPVGLLHCRGVKFGVGTGGARYREGARGGGLASAVAAVP
jgi:hypothetical protein